MGQLIPGLESKLEGLAAGAKTKVSVAPQDGYGVRDESSVQEVSKANFGGAPVEPGSQFRAEGPDGQARVVTVTKVDGDKVTVDANHPLAGVQLNFEVDVIRCARRRRKKLPTATCMGRAGITTDAGIGNRVFFD